MEKYTLYLRTNTINGKHYVGQTSNFRRREWDWHCLKFRYANNILTDDRDAYGLDNFSVEILNEVDTREEAWKLEQYYIEHYNSIYPNGYNISKGGSGNNGCHLSDETKKKISESLKGENNPKYWLGKQHSEETKKKISEAMPKKQVYQYTLEGELVKVWESIAECGRNGFNSSHIADCCNGKRKTHKGYKWSYKPL